MRISLMWVFLLTLVTKRFNILVGGTNFDLYAYPVLVILFLRCFKLNKREFEVLLFTTVVFVVSELCLKYYLHFNPILLIKQIVPLIVIYTASYIVMKKYSIQRLYFFYAQLLFYLSIFAMFQFFFATFNWFILLNKNLTVFTILGLNITRVTSIFPEPSHFAVVLIPAFFYFILSKGICNIKSLIVTLALFLTFSTTAFVTVLLAFMLVVLGSKGGGVKKIILLSSLVVGVLMFYPYVQEKISESTYNNVENLTEINMSSFSLLSNVKVAEKSLSISPLFGVGLGGHQEMYKKVFSGTPIEDFRGYGINYNSAHSLLIRIVSETGAAGLFLLLWFFYKYRVQLDERNIYSIISFASLTYFIARSFKLGGFFDYGIYFFFWSYFFSYLANKRNIKFEDLYS